MHIDPHSPAEHVDQLTASSENWMSVECSAPFH